MSNFDAKKKQFSQITGAPKRYQIRCPKEEK